MSDVASTPVPADLTSLASSYGVLRTSPAYPQVKLAIERLEAAEADGTDYADKSKDIIVVAEFADLLRSSQPLLARALVAAAIVGRISNSSTRGMEIALGLNILRERFPEALDARSHGLAAQRRLVEGARETWGLGETSLPNVDLVRTKLNIPTTVKRFEAILGDALSEIQTSLHTDINIRERIDAPAALSIVHRIETYLTKGTAVDHSHDGYVPELFASAARRYVQMPPSDLSTMSVQDWSREVVKSFTVPPKRQDDVTLAAHAVTALGFPPLRELWLSSLRSLEPDLSAITAQEFERDTKRWFERISQTYLALQKRLGTAGNPPPSCALVLFTATESRLAPFHPDPRFPAIALVVNPGAQPWESLGLTSSPNSSDNPPASHVLTLLGTLLPETRLRLAIEVEPDTNDVSLREGLQKMVGANSVFRAFSRVRSGVDFVFVHGFEPVRRRHEPGIVMPRTLADIADPSATSSAA